jgi:ABC-type sugar transport system, periplasmic component
MCVLFISAFSFVGCSSTTTAAAETTGTVVTTAAAETTVAATTNAAATTTTGKKWKILFVAKLLGHPYEARQQKAVEAAAKDFNMDITFTGPMKADALDQVKIIEDWLAKGIDGLVVSPDDPAALNPVMKKAMSMGVKVGYYESNADPGTYDYGFTPVDDKQYGEHLWDLMVHYMDLQKNSTGPGTGDYIILTGGLQANNLNNWIKFGTEMSATKYPQLKLLADKIPTDEQQQLAYEKALEVITAYPTMHAIMGQSSPTGPGAAQAIREKGKQNEIALVATSLPNQCKDFLKDGSIDCASLYDPGVITYVAAYGFKLWLEGTDISKGFTSLVGPEGAKSITTAKKEVTIGGSDGKTFVVGDPLDWTNDNVNNYDF